MDSHCPVGFLLRTSRGGCYRKLLMCLGKTINNRKRFRLVSCCGKGWRVCLWGKPKVGYICFIYHKLLCLVVLNVCVLDLVASCFMYMFVRLYVYAYGLPLYLGQFIYYQHDAFFIHFYFKMLCKIPGFWDSSVFSCSSALFVLTLGKILHLFRSTWCS